MMIDFQKQNSYLTKTLHVQPVWKTERKRIVSYQNVLYMKRIVLYEVTVPYRARKVSYRTNRIACKKCAINVQDVWQCVLGSIIIARLLSNNSYMTDYKIKIDKKNLPLFQRNQRNLNLMLFWLEPVQQSFQELEKNQLKS